MLRLPRVLPAHRRSLNNPVWRGVKEVAPAVALACTLALPAVFASSAAQDAAPPADAQAAQAPAQPAAPQIDPQLRANVDAFWHYGKIGRYDLAATEGQKILDSGAEPQAILEAFESVARERKDNLDFWMQRWLGIEQMKEVANKLVDAQQAGYRARAGNPQFIEQHIQRLSGGERAYGLAINRLRESGELAVPFMIDYLRDPSKGQHHAAIRRALRDLGRLSVMPLVSATQMQDPTTLTTVVTLLGEVGYDAALPYLARLAQSEQTPGTVKTAAAAAMQRLGGDPQNQAAADLYYQLAEKFYYDRAAVTSDPSKPTQPVWYWDEAKGLQKIDVPPAIYNELMAMRSAEYALELGRGADAQSLWLAANYKRAAELPEGATDATRAEGQPQPHFYGVSSGAQYLNQALQRALNDRNPAVALGITRSLGEIAGNQNVFTADASGPLVEAMGFPDRAVRFEAALAAAAARPQQSFPGQERVVPLLAEALGQTGQPSVLVALPNQDQLNAMLEALKGAGINAAGATTPEAAVNASAQLPAVDVVVLSQDLGPEQVEQLFGAVTGSPRLAGAARIIITETAVSPYENRKVADPLLVTTQAKDFAALQPVIEEARKRAGSVPMTEELATQYATRAAQQLANLAISGSDVLDLSAAKTTLLAALSDARPEIVKLAGVVLSRTNDRDAQVGLFTVANDEKTSDELKISLFKSLAANAKSFGNQLDASQIEGLQQTVGDAQNLDVRSAAAEAHGALNLPPDQAKDLIIKQSRK